jgi:flagellar basal-body rod modification protein FlgD
MITSAPSSSAMHDVSSPATSTSAGQPGGALGKNEFLKLLVAQLQHQDPMNPMAGDQMASQLAQFSSLEQLQQINSTLTGQQSAAGSLLGAVQAGAAINTIGHTVIATGNQVQIGGVDGTTSVTASFAGAADSATLHIFNANGLEVGSRSLGSVAGGKQTIDLGDAAKGLKTGAYTYTIDAKDSAGAAMAVQTYTTGKVDGISSGQNGIVLNVGAFTVPYSNVIQIIN